MQPSREFIVLTSIVLTFLGVVFSQDVRIYGFSQPPNEVLSAIDETRRLLRCIAHVLPANVSQQTITVNLSGLPTGLNGTVLLDELYLHIQTGRNLNVVQQSSDEVWITEQQTDLARVFIHSSSNGYRAIKMRNVSVAWLENNVQTAVLELNTPSSQNRVSRHLIKKKAFFVIYTFSTTPPTSPNCESYDVTITPQSLVNAAEFTTKICSPPDDVTFPLNGSTYFDVGAALRTSLEDNPIPRNAAVLRNPKCCHATKAISRRFARLDMTQLSIHVFELQNVQITECGCLIG
ncbi:uncharacterized protein LOC114523056 [Dendronephthya gigantea]|uniref:uncharacterized protein LOC114523056 n=1 Tax=Dendronephthya gigantea TaxID=151771 RepID=UPI00106D4785|nr:uncharacterized protein LOC114523056 [Dendronephthya gigantea]